MSPEVTTLSSQHVSLLIMLGKSHNIFILIHHTGSKKQKSTKLQKLNQAAKQRYIRVLQ